MRKIFPQTIAAQLVSLLIVILLIGQAVNLFLIIGERRIQARAQQFKYVIEQTVSRATMLPDISSVELPFVLRPNGQLRGAFFLSRNNRALIIKDTKHLKRYERIYTEKLRSAGINPLNVHVYLRTKRRGKPPQRMQGGRLPNKQRMRPLPPRDDLFRPSHPPDPTRPSAPSMQEIVLSAELAPGIWFNAMVPHYSIEAITRRLLLATVVLMALTLLTAWFFARRITKPLNALAKASDRLGRGETKFELQESGPEDMRRAAQAFNTMRERLTSVMDTQRTMLRAIGHDLRTPLAVLRIRAENIPPENGQSKFIATIDDMTEMTEEILSWSKDVSHLEDVMAVDLNALLSSLIEDYRDRGLDVRFRETSRLVARVRRISLKRAITNLIDNSLKYGKRARVQLYEKNEHFRIDIDDDGPGIPSERLDDVRRPFVRLEASRNKDTGGIGLGLSIADTIILGMGGKLELKNRKDSGLRASIHLPNS